MTSAESLIALIKEKTKQSIITPVLGVVKKVDGNLCDVQLTESDVVMSDVLLSAVQDKKKGWIIRPKVGSPVVVMPVGDDKNNLYVTHYSEVENIEGNIKDTHVKIADTGFVFERNKINLLTTLNNLIDEINKIIVVQGTSVNVPAMTKIKEDLKNILQ